MILKLLESSRGGLGFPDDLDPDNLQQQLADVWKVLHQRETAGSASDLNKIARNHISGRALSVHPGKVAYDCIDEIFCVFAAD